MEAVADLKAALVATARVCEKCGGSYKDVHLPGYTHYETDAGEPCPRYHYGRCPHCTNGVVFSDERARELLEELDRLRHVEQLYAASESLRKQLNDAAVKDATKFNELLERLKRVEEDSKLLDFWQKHPQDIEYELGPDNDVMLMPWSAKVGDKKWKYFSDLREAIRAARAKEGATK